MAIFHGKQWLLCDKTQYSCSDSKTCLIKDEKKPLLTMRKYRYPAFSFFPTMFPKGLLHRAIKNEIDWSGVH